MASLETINLATSEIKQASACLVGTINYMRKLSSNGYSTEREQITVMIGRLQILADRIGDEDITT